MPGGSSQDSAPPGGAPPSGQSAAQRSLPRSFYNPMTLVGAIIGSLAVGLILFLFLLEATSSGHPKPYVGIIAFVFLPPFVLAGLILMAVGVVRERRRRRRGGAAGASLPRIDLNDPRHRLALQLVVVSTVLVLVLSAFVSFRAYEYTDSNRFCGETCHSVMHPEYAAYSNSPHARVACVQCHIGPGAEWFVRSKLSGAYQVYATIFDKYPRPIPTPIDNLRPSRETCEQCHWPEAFFAQKLVRQRYYLSDEQNSPVGLALAVKVGGGGTDGGAEAGIHWHMNIDNEVSYVALDRKRTQIPWVRSRSRDGKQTVFRSTELDSSPEALAKGERRTMDCIDCHNRPTHIFEAPSASVNEAITLKRIDRSLPYVKKTAVELLDQPYDSAEAAQQGIRSGFEGFYREQYPELAVTKRAEIDAAVREIQRIFSLNYFPEMRVSWRSFQDNVGHLSSIGCFRCHDGKHVSDDGRVLSRECTACHTILSEQVGDGTQQLSLTGVDYRHPVDIGDVWKEVNCAACHGPQ